jgi:hypothetical protein
MNKFFYDLTRRNWGWPYHVILADILTIALLTLAIVITNQHFLWNAIIVFLVVNAVGYINELIQQDKEEFWEDIIANNCGIVLGVLKVWYVISIIKSLEWITIS